MRCVFITISAHNLSSKFLLFYSYSKCCVHREKVIMKMSSNQLLEYVSLRKDTLARSLISASLRRLRSLHMQL